jgi:hypothetical protein
MLESIHSEYETHNLPCGNSLDERIGILAGLPAPGAPARQPRAGGRTGSHRASGMADSRHRHPRQGRRRQTESPLDQGGRDAGDDGVPRESGGAANGEGDSEKALTLAAPSAGDKREERRRWNREYMRRWRERNRERYLAQNREYQRRSAMRRKIRAALVESNGHRQCWFCGGNPVEEIERVDPRTWQTVRVPYCGKC